MTLRIAAVDGKATDDDAPGNPIGQRFAELAFEIQEGTRQCEKAIIITQENGRVDWHFAGSIKVSEAIGLCIMASRAIEREVRVEQDD